MSKKLGMSIMVFLTATLLLYTGQIEADNWVSISQVILAAYAVGNVGEHYTSKMGS